MQQQTIALFGLAIHAVYADDTQDTLVSMKHINQDSNYKLRSLYYYSSSSNGISIFAIFGVFFGVFLIYALCKCAKSEQSSETTITQVPEAVYAQQGNVVTVQGVLQSPVVISQPYGSQSQQGYAIAHTPVNQSPAYVTSANNTTSPAYTAVGASQTMSPNPYNPVPAVPATSSPAYMMPFNGGVPNAANTPIPSAPVSYGNEYTTTPEAIPMAVMVSPVSANSGAYVIHGTGSSLGSYATAATAAASARGN